MYSSLLIQIALLATAVKLSWLKGCVQLSRAKRELPEGEPCRDKKEAQEGEKLGDWASRPPSRPLKIFTLGNRPQNNTARLYLPILVSVLPNNIVSIQLFLITLDRMDKSPGPPYIDFAGQKGVAQPYSF